MPNANVFEGRHPDPRQRRLQSRRQARGDRAVERRVRASAWRSVLAEHKLVNLKNVELLAADPVAAPRHETALAVLGISSGFETA